MQFHRFGIIKVVVMAALLALTSPSIVNSQPREREVAIAHQIIVYYNVVNYSDACAWITTYWSYKSEAHWRINGGPGHPQWLAPHRALGGSVTFNFAENGPQVRILAEVRPSAQCNGSGGTRVQTQRDFKQFPERPSYNVQLLGSRGSGYRWFIHS